MDINSASSIVLQVLTQATSQDTAVLKPAEEQLKQWETQPGFYSVLLVRHSGKVQWSKRWVILDVALEYCGTMTCGWEKPWVVMVQLLVSQFCVVAGVCHHCVSQQACFPDVQKEEEIQFVVPWGAGL